MPMDRMHCCFPIAGILTAAPYPFFLPEILFFPLDNRITLYYF